MPENFLDWIAWGGLVLPLSALGWAAVTHVNNQKSKVAHQEYLRLFEVADHLGKRGGSIASKMIAAYELRKFPRYSEVICNICDVEVDGDAASTALLKAEMAKTKSYLQ